MAEPATKPGRASNTWSVYFPVHMPGLELSVPQENGEDIHIKAGMRDLAKHANSFFAFGIRYDFRALNHQLWLDFNGWLGGYDLNQDDLIATLEPPPPDGRDLVKVTVDMGQRIVQTEAGLWLLQDRSRFDLGLSTGFRYYDQEIRVSGELPVLTGECLLNDCIETQPFEQENNVSWAEVTLGLTAAYRWHPNNALVASVSYGHEGSSRIQLVNTWFFGQSWFSSLGWRRDEFESDGVDIVENGAYFDVGKRF